MAFSCNCSVVRTATLWSVYKTNKHKMNYEIDLKILTFFYDKRGNLTFRVENILDQLQWDSNLLYNLYKMVRLRVLKYMPSTSRVDCRGISTV